MIAPALIATMIALASPTAHGGFQLKCQPITWADGYTVVYQQNGVFTGAQVVVATDICRQIGDVIHHRGGDIDPLLAEFSLGVLLHEAGHVAQARDGSYFSGMNIEHDAECRSLRGLPRVLRRLHYSRRFVRAATRIRRTEIRAEPAPYGGTCPG